MEITSADRGGGGAARELERDEAEIPADRLEDLLGLELPVIVLLAEKTMTLEEILALRKDSVIEFDKLSNAPLDLYVNNRRLGSGNAIKLEDRFGLHVGEIDSAEETLRKLSR